MPKVLIVEDDVPIADSAEQLLVKSGYEVCGIAGASATGIETPGGRIAATKAAPTGVEARGAICDDL